MPLNPLSSKDKREYRQALRQAQITGDVSEFVRIADRNAEKANSIPLFIKRAESKIEEKDKLDSEHITYEENERRKKGLEYWLPVEKREEKEFDLVNKKIKSKKADWLGTWLERFTIKGTWDLSRERNEKDDWL